MAVTVSSDLSVRVNADQNVNKLTDKQEALKESIQKGEPKVLGVSQVMLGFLVVSYSVPLLSAELTEVIKFGVPWWSGLAYVLAGAVALVMEKRNRMELIFICLAMTMLAAFLSVVALIIYIIDFTNNVEQGCKIYSQEICKDIRHSTMFSNGVKLTLCLLNMVQMGISCAFSYVLYKERRTLVNYSIVE